MNGFQIVLLCLSAVAVSAQFLGPPVLNGQCRPGWLYIEGACYAYGAREATWAEAQTFCAAAGASLAVIEKGTLNADLKRSVIQSGAECVWLGGADVFKQIGSLGNQGGNWQWVSTGNTLSQYQDWASGHPNNLGPGDYCLALSQQMSYAWRHISCNYRCNFICQKTR